MNRPSFDERFFSKVKMTDTCWLWTGCLSRGYGQIAHGGRRMRQAHRVAYELLVGPIPEGMQLDHLCRNRGCVRPDHLEPVTSRVNVLRGTGRSAQNARKTHCPQGHALSGANLFITRAGTRACRECKRAHFRRWYHRQKGATA